jgi:GntR family transcriptional regulator / MocR family aminotransferase
MARISTKEDDEPRSKGGFCTIANAGESLRPHESFPIGRMNGERTALDKRALRMRRPPFEISIRLDRSRDERLQRQIYDQIRTAILKGWLTSGSALPSTRTLAIELQCARNTVLGAFDQLLAEGYITGKHGAGTYVANILPEAPIATIKPTASSTEMSAALSQMAESIADLTPDRGERFTSFVPSVPEIGLFPFAIWAQLLAKNWSNPSLALARHLDARGWQPLREAITLYLRSSRMVECDSDQIFMTTGSQNSIDMVARLLLDPGDVVWVEDPCYPGVKAALTAAGGRLVPIALDRDGLSLDAVTSQTPRPRMIVVAPSHQYPIGCVMSLKRRLELLAFAETIDAVILEDDYDSEFRYTGEPLASMQGLDGGKRTIYVGTFSKTMFPAIRTGYIVVPKRFANRFAKARAGLDIQPSIVNQPALADFIDLGHFTSHVRRMRMIYMRRQNSLMEALEKHAVGILTATRQETGLHLIVMLDRDLNLTDREASARAARAGIIVPALSDYYDDQRSTNALLLGFAATAETAMEGRVLQLVKTLCE